MAISIADLIKQNTLGQSDGFPLGVPTSYNWYKGWNGEGLETPPANFTALAGWGQVYQEVGQPADSNPNATVQVANAQTYVHIKATGQWVLVENQSTTQLTGGHFATDFAGNTATTMTETPLAGGGVSFDAPTAAYNDHFWHTSRGTYAAGTVDAVYVQMDMRVTDPNEHVVAMVGADWWRDASAPFVADHSTNPGVGGSNWVELSTQWQDGRLRFHEHRAICIKFAAPAARIRTNSSWRHRRRQAGSFAADKQFEQPAGERFLRIVNSGCV